jgi:hypothetical protein
METKDDFPPDKIRAPQEIAHRALALFSIVGLALGAPRDGMLDWLKENSLWDELTPSELRYASSSSPTARQQIDASWRSEALLVLLWALGVIERMPALNQQCDTDEFQRVLPPFADVSVNRFINKATRRSDEVLTGFADELLNYHWEARDARIHGRPVPSHLDIGIIQERHHAINWIIGYGDLPWDEVTTDT